MPSQREPLHSVISPQLRLIATIGPASSARAPQLANAGATGFRLNASHLDPAALSTILTRLSRDVPGLPIVVDLQGAKMRLGHVEPRDVAPGDRVRFSLGAATATDVPLPHPEFFAQVVPGDILSLDDGRLRMKVHEAPGDAVVASVLNAGRLLPRKGLNVEQHPVRLSALTATDRLAVESACRAGATCFAFSFMVDGCEAQWLRDAAPGASVVGKIERSEAAERIRTIAAATDEMWICRGDLGAQLGAAALARFVSTLRPAGLPVPVLMAGQVLEHLTAHDQPTRSEVCHVFDLVQRGYAGFVLSDETAIGHDPVQAVRAAASLLRAFAS